MSYDADRNPQDVAIRLKDITKIFQIYEKPHHRLLQSLYRGRKAFYREFPALTNISFEVSKGDTLGIIGRNGAGKSTLLQIICGTMAQSSGDVEICGRMAALLELGAGFNPEFTGRENVFMYATVLGLNRAEIEDRFDDISNFADIGEFIDLPVKTYSSGMYVRLAFSVVMHIDPEILIVDEALAVGDASFQAKCMVAMKKLREDGVTLLFVSHDVGAIKALCNRAILLENGRMGAIGDTGTVVDKYYENIVNKINSRTGDVSNVEARSGQQKDFSQKIEGISPQELSEFNNRAQYQRIKKKHAEFLNVKIVNGLCESIEMCEFGDRVTLRMFLRITGEIPCIGLAYHIRDKNGFDVVYSDTAIEKEMIIEPKFNAVYMYEWTFRVTLKEGDYVFAAMASIPVDLEIGDVEVCDFVPIAARLKVIRGETLPMYGAVHWDNAINYQIINSD